MCKVILLTQSDKLDSHVIEVVCEFTVKFETKLFSKKIIGITLEDVTKPAVYNEACYNSMLLYIYIFITLLISC
jgi:hypothetical protein